MKKISQNRRREGLTLEQIRQIVEQEIKWHRIHAGVSKKSKDWQIGFIAGMKQIKQLFKNGNWKIENNI